ncbi:MAG: hypothetical protein AABM43_00590 [Actinomycetota bacterium]
MSGDFERRMRELIEAEGLPAERRAILRIQAGQASTLAERAAVAAALGLGASELFAVAEPSELAAPSEVS